MLVGLFSPGYSLLCKKKTWNINAETVETVFCLLVSCKKTQRLGDHREDVRTFQQISRRQGHPWPGCLASRAWRNRGPLPSGSKLLVRACSSLWVWNLLSHSGWVYWGEYSDLGGRKWRGDGEHFITRSAIICIPRQILSWKMRLVGNVASMGGKISAYTDLVRKH